MFPFIETLRMVDGKIQHLSYHQARLERTLHHFWPGCPLWSLEALLADSPNLPGVSKVRVVYNGEGAVQVEYASYVPRTIHQLRLVNCDDIDYAFKSTDRSCLTQLASQKGEADEIIIVRHGLLTDTSYSNIALYDGHFWYTPREPLLKGTMRQYLLDQGRIVEQNLTESDYHRCTKIALINAMLPLGTCVVER